MVYYFYIFHYFKIILEVQYMWSNKIDNENVKEEKAIIETPEHMEKATA